MKLLRNPIVTGLLVLAAVGMVFYQIYAPRWERARAGVPKPLATAVAAVTHALAPPAPLPTPHPAEPAGLAELVPDTTIERDFVKSHFDNWVESPPRDPFLLLGVQPLQAKELGPDTNSPIRKMKFKGMLDQTGSRVAVIDHDVYQRGDEIEGYKIIEIGSDEIWFEGPHGKERLGIDKIPLRTNFFPRAVTHPPRQP